MQRNISAERQHKTAEKLDYFLISNRWRSCVRNSETKWAPSIHRFGKPFDHALLHIQWQWRLKGVKKPPQKDYSGMDAEAWSALGEEIKKNVQKEQSAGAEVLPGTNEHIAKRVTCMNTSIRRAIDACVPNKDTKTYVRRQVSDSTREMYAERAKRFSKIEAQGGKVSRSMRHRWQRKLRDVNLKDYNEWLEKLTRKMEVANGQGDVKEVHNLVRMISGAQKTFPGTTPTVDENGDRILQQQRLTEVWKDFRLSAR